MRYSFHGKVRATGQQVDGYVEAETSTEAIDRLADQGIIGVYSVRAEPKQPRNPVLLAGTPEFERSQFEDPSAPRNKARKALPAPPMAVPYLPQVPLPAPVATPVPAVAEAAPALAPVPGVSDGVMLQLVDKLGTLIGQMQKFLDRPAQVVYATGPAREGKGGGGKRGASSRNISDAQNSTLKDIFQNNLDLRRSLQKLADTVTPGTNGSPAAPEPVPEPVAEPFAAPVAEAVADEATAPADDVITAEVVTAPHDAAELPTPMADHSPPDEPSTEEGDDIAIHSYDADHARHAQPAA